MEHPHHRQPEEKEVLNSLIKNAKKDIIVKNSKIFHDGVCVTMIFSILLLTLLYKIPFLFAIFAVVGILYAWLYPIFSHIIQDIVEQRYK